MDAAAEGLLRSAHDVSVGGLVATVVESCLPRRLGVRLTAEDSVAAHQWLFSESPTRVIVTTDHAAALQARCDDLGVGCRPLGVVTAGPAIELGGVVTLDVGEVAELAATALPRALGA